MPTPTPEIWVNLVAVRKRSFKNELAEFPGRQLGIASIKPGSSRLAA